MLAIVLSFLITLLMIAIILFTADVHSKLSLDHDLNGIQKMHETPTPRIGGLAIFISMSFMALYGANVSAVWASFYCGLITSVFFVFLGGLTEDLSKAVSPLVRISFVLFAILFGICVSHSIPLIRHMGGGAIDNLLISFDLLALFITCFAIVGISNAFNIIDGYNGLSSSAAIVNIFGLAYLAFMLDDTVISVISLGFAFSVLGFMVFNYPKGKIFLGDGGAYLIGFVIAVLSLNLIEHHVHQISPFSVLLLAVYPFTETVISMIRRKFIHRTSMTQPDNLHLHQLVYDRCLPRHLPLKVRNYRVMPIMLIFMLPQTILTVFFYKFNYIMLLGIAGYICYYLYFYMRLVRFKTPKYLLFNK